ncbi:MAG: ShlB/FhaC/HecB family hemolysin secretion/activation protein, partial [Betaproteobacteria bacterium]|nr:ShlB/FhaC/HecB family hemolysin secretion/activation protein [Betaproteobacteria bacterium]
MKRLFAAIALCVCVSTTLAQVAPDAGRIQQDFERGRVPPAPPRTPAPPVIEQPARPALKAPDNVRFPVKGFRITGSTAFSEVQLLPLLKDFVGKELSLEDLQRAADAVTLYYRDRGYFVARAYIPAQDVRDGIVEITVLEGRIGGVTVKPIGDTRLRTQVVEGTLQRALPAGNLIRQEDLERGLLLLNDLPGTDVRSVLQPGATLGTTNLVAELAEGPLFSGEVDVDNHGNRFSGANRLGGTLTLSDPTGYGDLANLRVQAGKGATYARLGYAIPVGYSGLKLGGAYTGSTYELCCEFAALGARGNARTATLSALYPVRRSRDASIYLAATFDAHHYFNETAASTTSDKKTNVVNLSGNGDFRDAFGGGGLSYFTLGVSVGQLNLDGYAPDRAIDDATAQANGSYKKVAYSYTRLQRLGESFSLYAGLSGQFASKNLDSSEKFALGGPTGVRAYPTGEAVGDEGLLANLELR